MELPAEISLFPLNTVLFPGGPLPLRIFEPRYLDMVSDCMKHSQGFGVCLIEKGSETGKSRTYKVGTLAVIRDWSNGPDRLLNILALGSRRFRILHLRTQDSGLNSAAVEWLAEEPAMPVPANAAALAGLLQQMLTQAGAHYAMVARNFESASWLGYRLAELLPMPLTQKQYLLEITDARMRLDIIETLVNSRAPG
ncbi:MAG: LON peptidase substrate-binding domain-containing protein [Gammaproteobacteria bacterium]|nr:LON peptidase substrate-binding domain-containing protein [Gammaproteobacteria bacterium]